MENEDSRDEAQPEDSNPAGHDTRDDLRRPSDSADSPTSHDRIMEEREFELRGEGDASDSHSKTSRHVPGSNITIDSRPRISDVSIDALKADFGDYELIEEIARGGMGVVFKARQKQLDRIVALKVILAGEFANQLDLERFQTEAEAAAMLQHPGIVPIYEVGECAGRAFFSMGYIDGETLAKKLLQGPFSCKSAARTVAKIAEAIDYAHAHGVVHRDLKPGNILIDQTGKIFVTDFGLAKRTNNNSHLTGTGQILGTPTYMAPEQAAAVSELIGPATDIYSLGAILYCLLTGHPPFRAASSMDTLMQVIHDEPVPPRKLNSAVDYDLQTICLKCLNKEPHQRYASTSALRDDLQRYLHFEPIHAKPSGLTTRLWRRCRRNPVVAMMGSMLALLLIVLAVVGPTFAVRQAKLRARADTLVAEKQILIDDLTELINQKAVAQQATEAAAVALKHNLIDMYVERGNSEIVRGRAVLALPWYALALEQEPDALEHEWGHRMRVASVLAMAPRPTHIWELTSEVVQSSVSPDGQLVLAGSQDGDLAVWEVASGQRVFQRPEPRSSTVRAVAFLADGKRFFSADTSRIFIWDLATQTSAWPSPRFSATIRTATIDAAGRWIVVGLVDGRLLVHDGRTGEQRRELPPHQAAVTSVRLSQDGTRLLTASEDHTARLYELTSGQLIAEMQHARDVVCAEFDQQSQRLVTASADGTAKLWSAVTGEQLGPTLEHPERLRVATFDTSGTLLATAGYDSAARIWHVPSGELLMGPLQSENSISALQFSADGKFLATASLDHSARIWETATGKSVTAALQHGFLVSNVQFLPGHNRLMTASADKMVRVWQFEAFANLLTQVRHAAAVRSSRLCPTGQYLLTASSDHTAQTWHAATGIPTGIVLRHGAELNSAEYSPDGSLIVTASDDGSAIIWNARTGTQHTAPLRHDEPVLYASFSGDSQRVVTAGRDGTAKVWDAIDGTLLHTLAHARCVNWATFDTRGQLILTCSDDRSARVWDASQGLPITPPLMHENRIEGGSFSPCGKFVVTASRDHTAQVWRLPDGARVGPPLAHHAGVHNAMFTPDSKYVLTGARDGSAVLWNRDDGQPLTPPMSIGHGLVRAVVSPCGKFIATGGGQAALLWESRTGRPLGARMQHDNWVLQVSFSPDSKRLITASDDGTARIWQVPEYEVRSKSTLVELAQLVSGHRADPVHGLTPLPAAELRALLERLPPVAAIELGARSAPDARGWPGPLFGSADPTPP